jgi:type IV fimbrial biogenesis protein FimT
LAGGFATSSARTSGLTLIQLLVALSIASVLLGRSLPAMTDFIAAQRATAAANAIVGAVNLARASAIVHAVTVTFCPRDAAGGAQGPRCGKRKHWAQGGLIYADRNRNGKREPDEALFGVMPALEDRAALYWRAFRNRSYLQFSAKGYTAWQNGTFQYCPASREAKHSRAVIINAQGRTALARDSDGDGIVEYANGDPLSCA